MVTAPYFIATKLEAFKGRGNNDYFVSHDLEDLVAVIDGRVELADEIEKSTSAVRAYIGRETEKLLQKPGFMDALPGYLLPDQASQERLGRLTHVLETLASLSPSERKSKIQ